MRFIDRIIATCASIAIAACGLPPMTALAAPQDELARARRELDTYGQQLAEVQTQLVKGADELNITESQIVEAQNEADQTKKELSEAQAILAEHIRENYRAGSSTLISVLLEAETVEDLVCRVYYLDKIAERNSNEIAEVRELQTSLDQQVTDLEAQRDEQQRMLDEAAEQAQLYTERIEEAQAYYNELNAKVQAQLEAEAAAAAAKAQAQASATARPVNNYGVITDGVQNAMEAITSDVPVAPVVDDESSDDESAQSEATEETSETSEEETNESNDSEETSTEEETTGGEQEATDAATGEETSGEPTGEDATDESAGDETGNAETDDEASASQTNEETPSEDTNDEQSENTEDEAAQTESEEQTEEVAEEESEPEEPAEEPEQQAEEAPAEEPEQQAEEEPAEEPQPAATAGNDGARGAIISMAYQYLGVPYVWGGKSPSGFDCSGLTTFCYENCGVDVGGNRTTYQLISWIQERGNWKTSMDELQPGDMLFPSAGHVAIYLGGGRMIHAPHEGDVVREADVYAFYGGGWAG